MSKDDDTKFTTPPVVFVLEEQIEKLEAENKKLRKDILMFQARYMELLPINKKLRECVEVMLEYSNCSWDKHPVRTEKESVEYVEKCLEEIEKE